MRVDPLPSQSSPRSASRLRRVTLNVTLALVALMLALLGAEVLIHLVGWAPPVGLFTVSAQEYARVPGIFSPNQRVTEGTGTRFMHTTRIDSLGYRGADISRRKAAGEFRILYVGDSFTYGHNVADGETLPAQLEATLKTVCRAPRVINAGLSGSTIVGQDVMAFRGLTMAPDLVVLMYHENDIDELTGPRIWDGLAENRRIKSRFPVSIVYRVLRRSAIWNLALDLRRSMVPHQVRNWERPRDDQATASAVEVAQREYSDHLAALADTLRVRTVPFVFALFPHPESARAGRGGRDYDRIRASAERIGLPTIDFLDALGRADMRVEDLFLLPEDYHPSARGYAVAADALSEIVLPMAPVGSCRNAK
jgi:lysophospholipase L1-like esterase